MAGSNLKMDLYMIRKAFGMLLFVVDNDYNRLMFRKNSQLYQNVVLVKKNYTHNKQKLLQFIKDSHDNLTRLRKPNGWEFEKFPRISRFDLDFLLSKTKETQNSNLHDLLTDFGHFLSSTNSFLEYQLDFPKGKKNRGEKNWECAKREVAEETGLDIDQIKLTRKKVTLTNTQQYFYITDDHIAQQEYTFITTLYIGLIEEEDVHKLLANFRPNQEIRGIEVTNIHLLPEIAQSSTESTPPGADIVSRPAAQSRTESTPPGADIVSRPAAQSSTDSFASFFIRQIQEIRMFMHQKKNISQNERNYLKLASLRGSEFSCREPAKPREIVDQETRDPTSNTFKDADWQVVT